MYLKHGETYRTACGNKVKVSITQLGLYEGLMPESDKPIYYTVIGRPFGSDMSDDPFRITGPWKDPESRFFLRARDGSYYGPNNSPVSYDSLEKAQYKCEELDWLFVPVLFLEQDGVR